MGEGHRSVPVHVWPKILGLIPGVAYQCPSPRRMSKQAGRGSGRRTQLCPRTRLANSLWPNFRQRIPCPTYSRSRQTLARTTMGAVRDDKHSFLPAPAFLKINVDFQGTSVPYTFSRTTSYCGRRQSFAFWLLRSQLGLGFFCVLAKNGVLAAKKLQPKRQFAARTPICSPNANLQPEHQFNATKYIAAQTPIRCRLPVSSPNANLQLKRQFAADLPPRRQFAANLQPKRQFAADYQFADQTPFCSPNANSLPISSPNANSLPNASLQPKRQFAAQMPIRSRLSVCSPNPFQQPKRMYPSTGCVPAHALLTY